MFVCQWLVTRARSISPKKMYARMQVTARGPSARRNQRCPGAVARLGGSENCKASCAGQAATQNHTSKDESFNLAELVSIIGYRLTAYIGGATSTQSAVDWLRDGLPPELKSRISARLY